MLTQTDFHEYQNDAVRYLLDTPRANLFAGMGAGKTPIVLTAFSALQLSGEAKRGLVLGPKRVAANVWPNEPAKWRHLRHLRVQSVLGNPKQRIAALERPADLYTINYENLVWLVEYYGKRWPFDFVVSDESTRLRRPSGKRFRAAKRIHKLPGRWVNLSGTPAPNGLMNLWGPNYLLDSGERLGTAYTRFRDHYFASDYMGYKWEPKNYAEEDIHDSIRDITMSVRVEDHLDIRDPVHLTIPVDLPPKALRQYREMERDMVLALERSDVEAANAAVLTGKCRQIASGAVYTDDSGHYESIHDAKIDALESILEESAGEPVLVGYFFRSTADRLRRAFPQARMLDDSHETENDWNAGRIPLLLTHPASAGHGINLQHGGRRLVLFDTDWDLELYQQIVERIGPTRQHQSGYDRAVYVYHLAASGTIDDDVILRRHGKATTQEALMRAVRRTK